jgi:hypothetical protein
LYLPCNSSAVGAETFTVILPNAAFVSEVGLFTPFCRMAKVRKKGGTIIGSGLGKDNYCVKIMLLYINPETY